jgi:alkylated DNA nucleotide flippase Atl1
VGLSEGLLVRTGGGMAGRISSPVSGRLRWHGRKVGSWLVTERSDVALSDTQAAILRRVRAIPPGYVRTYGDVSPGAPRLAGYVLSRIDAHDAPWHRVVRADGSLAKGARQRRLLEAEAVPFNGERVVLSRARLDDFDVV